MRVIAGRFKGFELAKAKPGTRPTTDRTKEAIFSKLEAWGVLDGARVLDLFAGTGALGIEALSRGADELVAVESAGPAAALIDKELNNLKRNRAWNSRAMKARVMRKRAERIAPGYDGPAFDVIFADPPYALTTEECNQLIADLVASSAADEQTVIIFERSTRSDPLTIPESWQISDQRHYGETEVYYIDHI
ncbi:16S rRNA (guanine(966)-N(2))-methyltransferase RsmD [Bifidobacterium sp. ESL0745]|uniref:16S rRNA (guanine(966)-N(2))-methyltransferase RsmD n=1 Tax=Bifidobacterium sp. ESL0745 TaxID=2983226 RepID=UPI0023F87961|nr:16S rRNA (guanine(966)-N(2))-methyltransferase RsmD [Bifidobacterium sp. ESL0745]MDF7666072.1 16S rRNA (guanine(966)-N(2))-methyltransferase RsmD [Bifidobacterium sp. ESL0745]